MQTARGSLAGCVQPPVSTSPARWLPACTSGAGAGIALPPATTTMLELTGILAGAAFLVGSVLLALRVDAAEARAAREAAPPEPASRGPVPSRSRPALRLVQGTDR